VIRRARSLAGLLPVLLLMALPSPSTAQAQPALSIADVAMAESTVDTSTFEFRIVLNAPAPAGGVRFDIASVDGSADSGDYAGATIAGAVIAEGETEYVYPVYVYGDEDYEPDETFFVEVSAVSGATVADGRATGTILNDETTPEVLVADTSVVEGDAGDTVLALEVRLRYPTAQPVRVDYETVNVTAYAPEDYEARSGSVSFAPGQTVGAIPITIHGDTESENTETFDLIITDVVGPATGGGGARISIITDDDADDPILPATLPDAALGDRYDQLLYMPRTRARFEITSGALPPGIELVVFNGFTYLIGIPTSTGTFAFSVTAYEYSRPVGHRAYTLTVGGPTLTLPPTTLPQAEYGGNYAVDLNPATGGQLPYRYTLTAGALPSGLVLRENGRIEGIARVSGSLAFTVTVTDSSPAGPYTATREYQLQVLPPVLRVEALDALSGTEGAPFEARFAVIGGGTDPYRFALSAGRLPAGLQMDENGRITGIVREVGDFPITVTVVDSTANVPGSGSADVVLQIEPAALRLSPSTLSDAVVGTFYSQAFTVDGGEGPYAFELYGGVLPPGLTLQADGRIIGIAETPGSHEFNVLVRDLASAGALAQAWTFRIEVRDTALQFPTAQLTDAIAGQPYQIALSAVGGIPPYRYGVNDGALPPGLGLSENGVLSGTPHAVGEFRFQLRAIDASGAMVVANPLHTLVVGAAGLRLGPARPRPALEGSDYRLVLQAEGGQAPYRYAVVAGTLPPGLSMSEDGVIAGVPQAAGSHAVTIAATDASALFGPLRGTLEYTLVVIAANASGPTASGASAEAPTAASRTLDLWAGTEATLDLTAGAEGGPFTDAEVVSLSPASAGSATIERDANGPRLHFVPAAQAVGRVELRYTLRSARGVSAPATLVFMLRARPDPAREARVQRALDLQLRNARRFADAQIGNVRDRLERIRDLDRFGGFDNGLRMLAARPCAPAVGALPGRACDPDASDRDARDGRASWSRTSDRTHAAFGLWAGGTVRPSNHDGRNGGDRLGFETDGVSFGADFRPGARSVLGFGVGYARDGGAFLSDDDGRSRSEALGLVFYGGLRLREHGFVDALVGQQRLGFDLRGGDTADSAAWHGRRNGDQWFAALSAGAEFGRNGWRVVPYARLQASRLRLSGYVESFAVGADVETTPESVALPPLTYAPLDVADSSLDLGLRIEHRRETAWGAFAPHLRAEYRRDLDARGEQALRYADLPAGEVYRTTIEGFARRRLELSVGLDLAFARGWSLTLDGRASFGDEDRAQDRSLQLGVQARF
jgi:outer membrane autotransporter protein